MVQFVVVDGFVVSCPKSRTMRCKSSKFSRGDRRPKVRGSLVAYKLNAVDKGPAPPSASQGSLTTTVPVYALCKYEPAICISLAWSMLLLPFFGS